jgi:hypothetical protein
LVVDRRGRQMIYYFLSPQESGARKKKRSKEVQKFFEN